MNRPALSPLALASLALLTSAAWLVVSDVLLERVLGEEQEAVIVAIDALVVVVGVGLLFALSRAMVGDSAARTAVAEAEARDLELQATVDEALLGAGTEAELHDAFVQALVARGVAGAGVLIGRPDGSIDVVAAGGAVAYFDGLEVRWDAGHERGRGPVGIAYRERRSVVVDDSLRDPLTAVWSDRQRAHGFRAMAAFPLVAEDQVLGVLSCYFATARPLTAGGRRTLELVAGNLARGLLAVRRRAEVAAASERLRRALDASPSPILLIDPGSRVAYANRVAADTFGYPLDELLGLPLAELVPVEHARAHEQEVSRFVRRPHVRRLGDHRGLSARRRDGTVFPADISLGPVEIDGGMHVVCTVVDLSATRALEARLLQAQKMETMGQFANILAHDFRNYLSAIGGFADLALSDAADDAALEQDLDQIRRAVGEAATLIRNVLSFARPQAGEAEVTDLASTLPATTPLLARIVGPTVRVVLEDPGSAPPVMIAPSLLGQVLLNLASNARDAMPRGGTLTVGATHDGEGMVAITVRDTGTGMSDEAASRLFDAFYTTKGDGRDGAGSLTGTGLGLTSVRFIVERAGGRISVETAPAAGCTFRVELPVAPAPAPGLALTA